MHTLALSHILVLVLGVFSKPLLAAQDDVRVLRFGPNHVERISAIVVDELLALRGKYADTVDIAAVKSSVSGAQSVSDTAILALVGRRGFGPGFVDVTNDDTSTAAVAANVEPEAIPTYPTPNPAAHSNVATMSALSTPAELSNYVKNISTSLATRYYRSSSARAASLWVQARFAEFGVTTALFENSFDQPNVIATLPGDGTSSDTIIIGAHLDSTSQRATTSAPGADDDGSGVAIITTALRILKASGWVGKYPVEAHAYAGEEGGLLGSTAMAKAYKAAGRGVRGMLEVEMVGWQPNTSTNSGKSSTITVISDPIAQMSSHLSSVVAAYVPTAELRSSACGYGCSDHDSWNDQGYPVVCIAAYGPNDASLNPYYHSTSDTYDKLNYTRMNDFVKATIAWIVEVSS